MNYFFGLKNSIFSSELQIPRFQNNKYKNENICLFTANIYQNNWIINQLDNNEINNDFYLIKKDEISSNTIYFLAKKNDITKYTTKELNNFNNYTDTFPAYRSNFKVIIENGGFSSFQSEYPYYMMKKRGGILSSVCSIANPEAEFNYILIRNIIDKPIRTNFKAYLINIKNKKIEKEYEVKTNHTNCLHIENSLINPDIFLFTDKFLGIPMFVSINNKHLSIEHTHAPHDYILSEDKYEKVSKLKEKFYEIIS